VLFKKILHFATALLHLPKVEIGEKWVKITNYPPQCST